MPAAAVIPAPVAYIKVVAVKKLVVGFRDRRGTVCAAFERRVHCPLGLTLLLDARPCS